MKPKNELRIIAGCHRGRKISFPDIPGLRPTLDHIRETVFNWLQGDIVGATCLDLFAGSGAFGFEALSRGAKSVYFVDENHEVIDQIHLNANKMSLNDIKSYKISVPDDLSLFTVPFDIIFLDPPFHTPLLQKSLEAIFTQQLVKPGGLIYIEHEKGLNPKLPEGWMLTKHKSTKNLEYGLIQT